MPLSFSRLMASCGCVRRQSRCEIMADKRTVHGCFEYEYTRVCDDVTHPIMIVGEPL